MAEVRSIGSTVISWLAQKLFHCTMYILLNLLSSHSRTPKWVGVFFFERVLYFIYFRNTVCPGGNLTALYRVARSRLTHFDFEYCAGAIACRGWWQGER